MVINRLQKWFRCMECGNEYEWEKKYCEHCGMENPEHSPFVDNNHPLHRR